MFTTIRLFFSKSDRARYISHLDITRVFSRAIARSGVPVWFTQGFNPRAYMTFPLPLSLGYQGDCESLDMRLTQPDFPLAEVTARLNAVLPAGIRILETVLPQREPEEIALADYQIELEASDPAALRQQLEAFCAQPAVVVLKKSKKGQRELDIRPLFTLLETQETQDGLSLRVRLAAGGTLNISPGLLLDAFHTFAGVSAGHCAVCRRAILTAAGEAWK